MPPASLAPADRSFIDRKAEGTRVEWLLSDMLTEAGMLVIPYQAVWDAAPNAKGEAKALREMGSLHLPDLEAIAPIRMGFEVKSKEPRRKDGSIGWDSYAFRRAEEWQEATGVPVFYVIRDKTIAPVPSSRSEPDNLSAWYCASLYALRQYDAERTTHSAPSTADDAVTKISTTLWWPRDVFWPLADLLEGRVIIAPVPLRCESVHGVSRLL